MELDLAPTNAYGLRLRSPLLVAAGALGYGVEYARLLDINSLGALVSRTTSLHPRRAASPPQLLETPAGLLYAGGDANAGLRYLLDRCAPAWAGWSLPVIVSVGGATAEQCAEVAEQLVGAEGVAGVEFNLARFVDRAAQAVRLLRAATALPLVVKLPIDAPEIAALAQAAAAAGADAIAVSGAPLGLWIDPASGERVEGWFCGPALRPLALRAVAQVAAAVQLPIVGGGGVDSVFAARQFLAAGASAVSVGAALLADPALAQRIAVALAPAQNEV